MAQAIHPTRTMQGWREVETRLVEAIRFTLDGNDLTVQRLFGPFERFSGDWVLATRDEEPRIVLSLTEVAKRMVEE